MKLTQKRASPFQSVLLYGPPKTGKTQLAGSLSKHFNLIWFDLENGYATLLKLPQDQQERIEIVSLPDNRSWPIAIETCLKIVKGGTFNICEKHGKVSCPSCAKDNLEISTIVLPPSDALNTIVVFDSITQLSNSAIAHITKEKSDEYKLQQDDWGNLGKLLDIFFSHVQTAKFHVLCISHETEAEQEDGKTKIVPTAGTRNFSRNVSKYFGHVVYAQVSNMSHRFVSKTTATPNIMVGSRTDADVSKNTEDVLADIFMGKVAAQENKATPAASAVSNLEALKASLIKKG